MPLPSLSLSLVLALAQPAATGPSFSCAHVTSSVNKIICGSPSLSALDRELANLFNNMRGQPLDQRKLQQEESAWLAGMLRDCQDAVCIESKYEQRITQLRDQSLRAASPAVYDETRPFPVPAELLEQARALIGKSCTYQPDVVGPVIPGFKPAPRFLPVILAGGVTVVREKGLARFAFLVSSNCAIRDVAALPAAATGEQFLQCSVTDPPMTGFGVRNPKTHALEGFWAVDADTQKFRRIAIGVLGIQKAVRCQQPESAE